MREKFLCKQARCTRRAVSRNDDEEHLKKNLSSVHRRSSPTGGRSSRCPHILTTSTQPAMAHYTFRVRVRGKSNAASW
jgi:hypothetical protein